MGRPVACEGQRFSVQYARCANGETLGLAFFDALPESDKRKVAVRLQYLADGLTTNRENFGVLNDGIFEIKSFQIRLPYAVSSVPGEKGVILITHGFRKKKDKTPRTEIDRAKRILEEDKNRADKVLRAGQ